MHRGRFAPTPSGLLHFGSIIAALGSYLSVKSKGGTWHLRIDDLDPPRVKKEAIEGIQSALIELGLKWDGPVVFQSQRQEVYEELLQQLISENKVYPCNCTRKQLLRSNQRKTIDGGVLYPGTCRNKSHVPEPHSWRLAVEESQVSWTEPNGETQIFSSQEDFGDFVIKRRDGVFSYHLANICDDRDMQITEVVRGLDLQESSARHIYMQQSLGLSIPQYRHLPLAKSPDGQKLSKQYGAKPISTENPQGVLLKALQFLNIQIENQGTVEEILQEATEAWKSLNDAK